MFQEDLTAPGLICQHAWEKQSLAIFCRMWQLELLAPTSTRWEVGPATEWHRTSRSAVSLHAFSVCVYVCSWENGKSWHWILKFLFHLSLGRCLTACFTGSWRESGPFLPLVRVKCGKNMWKGQRTVEWVDFFQQGRRALAKNKENGGVLYHVSPAPIALSVPAKLIACWRFKATTLMLLNSYQNSWDYHFYFSLSIPKPERN